MDSLGSAHVSQQNTILAQIDRWELTTCGDPDCFEPVEAVWLHGDWRQTILTGVCDMPWLTPTSKPHRNETQGWKV